MFDPPPIVLHFTGSVLRPPHSRGTAAAGDVTCASVHCNCIRRLPYCHPPPTEGINSSGIVAPARRSLSWSGWLLVLLNRRLPPHGLTVGCIAHLRHSCGKILDLSYCHHSRLLYLACRARLCRQLSKPGWRTTCAATRSAPPETPFALIFALKPPIRLGLVAFYLYP